MLADEKKILQLKKNHKQLVLMLLKEGFQYSDLLLMPIQDLFDYAKIIAERNEKQQAVE